MPCHDDTFVFSSFPLPSIVSMRLRKCLQCLICMYDVALSCPNGKEYQPCVQPCAAKTCLNKWFYEESPCSYLREDCVCKNGTILHRTDSDLCIPEEKCGE